MDESYIQHQAAQFRVALLLKQYKFGAASAAKYLGKSRGLVQSWMQIGNKHYLAKEKIKLKSFERIVKTLRRKITEENLDYFLVGKLLNLELPVAFISKVMDLPTSTVRSWKYGKVPNEIKKFFYDPKPVEHEYNKLFKFLRSEVTRKNIEYFLAVRLANTAREKLGRRRIGGRIISQILTRHFNHLEPIPEKTVSCWIDGKRRPWDAFEALVDENKIKQEYRRIIDDLTFKYLTYHISKALADKYNWKYSKISKVLEINKELVRGWVKKDRGNPVAKIFVNSSIVNEMLEKYISNSDKDKTNSSQIHKKISTTEIQKEDRKERLIVKENSENASEKSDIYGIDKELEQELIYHLGTFPTGVTSAKVLKSILIDQNDVSVQKIEHILRSSKYIVKSRFTGKWILKKSEDKLIKKNSIDNELAKINCDRDGDEVICSD